MASKTPCSSGFYSASLAILSPCPVSPSSCPSSIHGEVLQVLVLGPLLLVCMSFGDLTQFRVFKCHYVLTSIEFTSLVLASAESKVRLAVSFSIPCPHRGTSDFSHLTQTPACTLPHLPTPREAPGSPLPLTARIPAVSSSFKLYPEGSHDLSPSPLPPPPLSKTLSSHSYIIR